jgi:hypothetical protein
MFFSPEGSQERDDPKREWWARLRGFLSCKRHALGNRAAPTECVGLLFRVIMIIKNLFLVNSMLCSTVLVLMDE